MKRTQQASVRPNFFFKPSLAALAVATCFLQTSIVMANPTGANVAAGNAQINANGNTLNITNTPGTIINWQQFGINANETTRFLQQSANSAVLNRVVGNNPSQIYGTLQSNGQVYLINQNGILIGPNAFIDVNKLVLSTLNLTDANFLNKNFSFSGGGYGQLLNQGKISTPLGGSVYLIGSDIRNEGIITTPQGTVVLAAGNSVSLTDSAGPELTVTVNASGNKAVNLGTISAAGGQINMFGALIEQQGVLSADSASVDAQGRIILKASDNTTVSGTVSATNSAGKGGEIQVLGNNVTLTSTANLDASGATGGGTVLVGGDLQGANANIQNATTTTMQAGATIKADATQNGDGGKVVLWANGTTDFKGAITAQGGALGGNGGQVETSGHQNLLLGGSVNTLAPLGKRGFWLLDPQAYCLDDSGSFCSSYIVTGATFITTGNLATMLNSSDVVLSATDYIVLGSVTLGSSGFTRSGANLTLLAPSIQQFNTFSPDVTLNLTMKASGTSVSYAAKSGQVDLLSSTYTEGGNLIIEAEKRIVIDGTSFTTYVSTERSVSPPPDPWSWGTSGNLILHSPDLIALGSINIENRGNDTEFNTNKISGALIGTTASLNVSTYTPGFNIYLGQANSDPVCGTTGLCITNQLTGLTGHETYISAGRCPSLATGCSLSTAAIDGDVFIGGFGSSWSVNSARDYLEFIGKNIKINEPFGHSGSSSIRPDQHVLGFTATGRFTNLASSTPFFGLGSGKLWNITVGDYAGSSFGGLDAVAQIIYFATLAERDAFEPNDSWNNSRFPRTTNAIFVVGTSGATGFDPCKLTPGSCNATATNPNGAPPTEVYDPVLNGPLTIAAELTADERYIARGDTTIPQATNAVLTQTSVLPKLDIDKSFDEVRKEARKARKDAEELEAEAQEAEKEARQAEAEAKTAKSPEQRANAQRRAERKRSEANVKRAQAASKRTESGSREALANTKQVASDNKTATPAVAASRLAEARTRQIHADEKHAETQARQATAESKQADSRAKQADADAKKAEAEVRSAKTPDQKRAANQKAEVKKTEAQAYKAESDARKAEAEGKQAEAQAQKAEGGARKAEDEARLAKSPQQKAAAEKRAEAKKSEAGIKKSEAEAKQIEAEGKQARAEGKFAEADAKAARSPGGRAVNEKRANAKGAEGEHKQAEAAAKKAEAGEKKARAEEKLARTQAATEKNAQKKAAAEKKAEAKKAEAEQKQAELKQRKAEAEKKKVEAEKKAEEYRVAEGKRSEERRAESAKAFGTVAAGTSQEGMAAIVTLRHELKTEALQPALSVLERNPSAADLPPCSGSAILCVPDGTPASSILPQPLMPTVSFLPQIQRKIAVVIGVNNYADPAIPSLETALPDAQAIGKQLNEQFGYETRVVANASRIDLVSSLNRVARDVGPNDSVTIYYAGHGYLNEKTGVGYWIPGDAKASSPDNWLSNKDITKLLNNIPAKQVMLVSDSCYSGALTREQWVAASGKLDPNGILAKRSVTVMSSGGDEPVSDEGKDGHSIFAYAFMQSLKSVKEIESAGKLFESVRTEVSHDFPQVPQYGGAASAGHTNGGDFLFEKRSFK